MRPLERIHSGYVHPRRVRVLSHHFAVLFPPNLSILDVGCGDGLLSQRILKARTDLQITGVDVLERNECHIPIQVFDGETLPFDDDTFDATLLVDVLHHTDNPAQLLKEAKRVSRRYIAIKDHTRNGVLAGPTLRFMDSVGNARFGVALPYHYWAREQWMDAFESLNLKVEQWTSKVPLYPWPASLVFCRGLHFCALLSTEA